MKRAAGAVLAALLLAGCGGESASTPPPKPASTPAPSPSIARPNPTVARPGAFCPREGATGKTEQGAAMRCTRKASEERARWRAVEPTSK